MNFRCLECNKDFISHNRPKYCSRACHKRYEFKQRIANWKRTGEIKYRVLRRYLLEEQDNKCKYCLTSHWMGQPLVLELEHKDGNSENNQEKNVCMLCPNCHSLTPTYKNRNIGNGRHKRRQRYQDGKSY